MYSHKSIMRRPKSVYFTTFSAFSMDSSSDFVRTFLSLHNRLALIETWNRCVNFNVWMRIFSYFSVCNAKSAVSVDAVLRASEFETTVSPPKFCKRLSRATHVCWVVYLVGIQLSKNFLSCRRYGVAHVSGQFSKTQMTDINWTQTIIS